MWKVTYDDESTEEFEDMTLELVCAYVDDKKKVVKIEYKRSFDIMNAREISTNVNTNEDFKERVLKKILEYEKGFSHVDDFEITNAIGWLYEEIRQMCVK